MTKTECNVNLPLKVKLYLVLRFCCHVHAKSVLEEHVTGRKSAVLASHMHVPLL